jgi:drug/metabolite transporter (DMT)-like permease
VLFSAWWLGETPRWNEWAALALIVAAVIVMLYPQLRTGGPTHQ